MLDFISLAESGKPPADLDRLQLYIYILIYFTAEDLEKLTKALFSSQYRH